jgi:formylmethanofuran dehydrogenase subunit E
MEGYSEFDQVQLIRNLAERLNDFATLDKVVFELVEFGTIDAWIGALVKDISKGEEIDQCAFCGEYKVIVGRHDLNGEIYCAQCKEEEEGDDN